jgi:hypothetical protein
MELETNSLDNYRWLEQQGGCVFGKVALLRAGDLNRHPGILAREDCFNFGDSLPADKFPGRGVDFRGRDAVE